MEETQILDVADRLIKNLSKGYKQQVGIAQTLLGNPKVIILDEPTVGLDPIQVVEIRKLLSRKFAAIDRAVLRNDKLKANLEEIFIELTSPQPDGPEENREEEA